MSSDRVPEGLTVSTLKAKWENSFDEGRNDFNTRMRRATS